MSNEEKMSRLINAAGFGGFVPPEELTHKNKKELKEDGEAINKKKDDDESEDEAERMRRTGLL